MMEKLLTLHPMTSILSAPRKNYFNNSIAIVTACVLLIVAGQISIPIQPVPITLQSLAVLFVGLTFGLRNSVASVALYLFLGAIGLPVFANAHGSLLVIFGPTGGYLLSYLFAVYLSSYLLEKGLAKNRWGILIAAVLAAGLILVMGTLWLAYFIGFNMAIKLGIEPFILVEIGKIALLLIVVPKFWKKMSS